MLGRHTACVRNARKGEIAWWKRDCHIKVGQRVSQHNTYGTFSMVGKRGWGGTHMSTSDDSSCSPLSFFGSSHLLWPFSLYTFTAQSSLNGRTEAAGNGYLKPPEKPNCYDMRRVSTATEISKWRTFSFLFWWNFFSLHLALLNLWQTAPWLSACSDVQ